MNRFFRAISSNAASYLLATRTLCSTVRQARLAIHAAGLLAVMLLLASTSQPVRADTGTFSFLNEDQQSGDTTSHGDAPKTWLTNTAKDWMGKLPDYKELNRISIPGTHDTGAQCCGLGVRTQTWTIAEQLAAGIRFFDIRVRRAGYAWAIHHDRYYLKMMFGDVMNAVVTFLKAHPTEVVFMRLKEDYAAQDNSDSHDVIWNNYLETYGSYIYSGAQLSSEATRPRLKDVRGKVFVLSQISEVNDSIGGWWSNQTIQDYYKVYFLQHDQTKSTDWATLPAKKRLIKKYIDKARAVAAGGGPLVFNFLSGAYGMTPDNVADYTNDTAYDYIASPGYARMNGVLVMDFPGEQLVYRIIKSNFTSSVSCPAKTYRVTSAHSWAEFRLPAKRKGTIIDIPGGAYNKYASAKCNRVRWSDLQFYCSSSGVWQKAKGSWGSDALCHGSKGNSPYVFTGNR